MQPFTNSPAASAPFVPLRLADSSLGVKLLLVLVGTLILTAASWIEVPMVPVPVSMQTYAIAIIGALYGWRLGAVTVVVWLGEGAAGLPVLAGGDAGLFHFWGNTAGYLFAFPLMAALIGWLAERGWTAGSPIRSAAAMLLGSALVLLMGTAWLAVSIGLMPAITYGLLPFLIGDALKSGLAAATVDITRRVRRAR